MDYLLDVYIEHRLYEVVSSKQNPTEKQTKNWLIWLARQLKVRSWDEFLIEQMQPAMLETRQERQIYALVFGLIFGSAFSLFFTGYMILFSISNLEKSLITGMLVFCLAGIYSGLNIAKEEIITIEVVNFHFSRFVCFEFFRGAIQGMLFGLLLGGITKLILLRDIPVATLSFAFSGIFGLFFGFSAFPKSDLTIRIKPNQGILVSARNTAMFMVLALCFSGLFLGLIYKPFISPSFNIGTPGLALFSLPVLLLIGVTYITSGGLACIQHFALRVALHNANSIPWNYARFLNYCTERLLLQRVGGRYRFIHKLVQEHFASMPLK